MFRNPPKKTEIRLMDRKSPFALQLSGNNCEANVARGRTLGDSYVRPISFKRGVFDYQILSAVMYLRPHNL